MSRDEVAIWPESTWPTFRVPAAGISRGGDWANRYWISADLASFQKEAQDLFDKQGKRLIYMATFRETVIGVSQGLRAAAIGPTASGSATIWPHSRRPRKTCLTNRDADWCT
ncbi:MAG TPA: hypothetical protein VKY85_13895 [Candidatus Angelobacter sp.]|nr:hypothetical protein [Candidatus Angelobacter sp.]